MVFTPDDDDDTKDQDAQLLVTESAAEVAHKRLWRLLEQEGWQGVVVRGMPQGMPQPFVTSAQGQCHLHFFNGVRIQVTAHRNNDYSVQIYTNLQAKDLEHVREAEFIHLLRALEGQRANTYALGEF